MKLSFDDEDLSSSAASETASESEHSNSARKPRAAIFQYNDCEELSACTKSIEAALTENGVDVEITVGRSGSELRDISEKAGQLAVNGGVDLAAAVGTPCAEAVCPLFTSSGRTPVVFCAVTDPVGAGLVDNINSPSANCTGTAAAFGVKERFDMIYAAQPAMTKLGVIYSASEQNCESQLNILAKECESRNIQLVETPADTSQQLPELSRELMDNCDAVMLLQDNMLMQNSWPVISQSIGSAVPIYGVTLGQIEDGCAAGYCYDFEKMGEITGEQAVRLLHGETAQSVPVVEYKDCTLYYNEKRMTELFLEFTNDYKKSAKPASQSLS